MSLIQRVTALAQAVAADIKALYAGKAEKEHTHTAAQVSGLGTAATKPSSLTGSLQAGVAGRVVWSPATAGTSFPAVQYNYPGTGVGGGGFARSLMQFELPSRVGVRLGALGGNTNLSYGIFSAAPFDGWWADPFAIRVYNGSEPRVGAHQIRHAGNTLLLGATKTAALTTLNLTQQEKAIKDPSGLWVESGALTNDMSSYLSSKTYAEMRTKLGVVPVEVVQGKGQSTTDVVSQKAVTDAFKVIEDALGFLLEEEGEGGTLGFWIDGLSSAIDEYRNELIGKIDDLPTVSVVQESGTSSEAVMSQKAVTDAIAAGGGVEVVQSSGYSPDKVMSQEAVTYSLKRIEDRLDKLEFAMSPIINFDGEVGTIGYWLNQLGGQ